MRKILFLSIFSILPLYTYAVSNIYPLEDGFYIEQDDIKTSIMHAKVAYLTIKNSEREIGGLFGNPEEICPKTVSLQKDFSKIEKYKLACQKEALLYGTLAYGSTSNKNYVRLSNRYALLIRYYYEGFGVYLVDKKNKKNLGNLGDIDYSSTSFSEGTKGSYFFTNPSRGDCAKFYQITREGKLITRYNSCSNEINKPYRQITRYELLKNAKVKLYYKDMFNLEVIEGSIVLSVK